MENTSKTYRIRTKVGQEAPSVIYVPLNQTYDMFEILSLKLNQVNSYQTYESDYGVIVGRVQANGGVGVQNAKLSIFIEVEDNEEAKNKLLYNFTSVTSKNDDNIRYNLLPDFVDDACHQNVGTFPNKRLVLDNNDVIEVFDKYWKYTTTTNKSGDYMIFGVPTGSVTLHVDVDLSDCGILSQRPHDMVGKGYNINMFESPNKFKASTDLNSLAQIYTQNKGVYVYPYWGDASDGDERFAITRCDIDLDYKFEPTCVFMGSIVTDKGGNAIGKNCTATKDNGKMSELVTGEGSIEMIRKTLDGKVEEFPIKGNRVIDSNGVWCYQIPMNLDYVTTDEFGNLVPTDNPEKGIATRTRVRFRISLDENPADASARKRCKYLVPNNPRLTDPGYRNAILTDETEKVDYNFGSNTREESYVDLFWNKVYTVKNYIPKLQTSSKVTNRKHTGIKMVNHFGDNNPMPYNAMTIKLGFTYRLICVLTKIFIQLVMFLNQLLSLVGFIFGLIIAIIALPLEILNPICRLRILGIRPFGFICSLYKDIILNPIKSVISELVPVCIGLSSEFCDDSVNRVTYYVGCGRFFFDLAKIPDHIGSIEIYSSKQKTEDNHSKIEHSKWPTSKEYLENFSTPAWDTEMLYNCIENNLAQDNEATSFNFYNDWINGVLYAPLWYRKVTKKRKIFFGLFGTKKAKDEWCSADLTFNHTLFKECALPYSRNGNYKNYTDETATSYNINGYGGCGDSCDNQITRIGVSRGLIRTKPTMLGQTVYYYTPCEYDASLPSNNLIDNITGENKLLFATDIVLLGSLNECDIHGVPQFFKSLDNTTYNMPTDILNIDYDYDVVFNPETGQEEPINITTTTENTGCDWGNPNEFGKYDGGLFYSIGCSTIDVIPKSCVNLTRICEFGVSLDETRSIEDLSSETAEPQTLVADGFVSFDELYNLDERAMFATMNGNRLKTKLNTNSGFLEYDFKYLYPQSFDGSNRAYMQERTGGYSSDIKYKNNYKLENFNQDYWMFRMGNEPYFYDSDNTFPKYENSFYFYFGLKDGKTAIEKFNEEYFAECSNTGEVQTQIGVKSKSNSWCSEMSGGEMDGYALFDFSGISTPYRFIFNNNDNPTYSFTDRDLNSSGGLSDEKFALIGSYSDDYEEEGVKIFEDYTKYNVMIPNGSYTATVTDAEGNITDFVFNIDKTYLTYIHTIRSFKKSNTYITYYYPTLSDILNRDEDIGGVVNITNVMLNNIELDNYVVEIRPNTTVYYPNEDGELYDGIAFRVINGLVTEVSGDGLIRNGKNDFTVMIPIGGIDYTLTVTQYCGELATQNYVKNIIPFSQGSQIKFFINDVDYELIKNFNGIGLGWNINENSVKNRDGGWNLQNDGNIDIYTSPWLMSHNVWNLNNFPGGIQKLYVLYKFRNEINGEYYDELPVDLRPLYAVKDEATITLKTDINDSYKVIDETVYASLSDGDKAVYVQNTETNNYEIKEVISKEEYNSLTEEYKWLYTADKYVYDDSYDTRTEEEYNSLNGTLKQYYQFACSRIDEPSETLTIEEYEKLGYRLKEGHNTTITRNQYNKLGYRLKEDHNTTITRFEYDNLPYKLIASPYTEITRTRYDELNIITYSQYNSLGFALKDSDPTIVVTRAEMDICELSNDIIVIEQDAYNDLDDNNKKIYEAVEESETIKYKLKENITEDVYDNLVEQKIGEVTMNYQHIYSEFNGYYTLVKQVVRGSSSFDSAFYAEKKYSDYVDLRDLYAPANDNKYEYKLKNSITEDEHKVLSNAQKSLYTYNGDDSLYIKDAYRDTRSDYEDIREDYEDIREDYKVEYNTILEKKINNEEFETLTNNIDYLYELMTESEGNIGYVNLNGEVSPYSSTITYNKLKREFIEKNGNGVPTTSVTYNWTDSYRVTKYDTTPLTDEEILSFINDANEIVEKRNELAVLMQDGFSIYSYDTPFIFNLRAQTAETPAKSMVLYHPETTIETENYESQNILSNKNTIYEQNTFRVNGIKLPTISYDENFNVNVFRYKPNENPQTWIEKRPFTAGVANNIGDTIPYAIEKLDSLNNITNEELIKNLFTFPLIDRRLIVQNNSWGFINNVPYWNPSDANNNGESITMCGYITSTVINGRMYNNAFDSQNIGDFGLIYGNNYIGNPNTYCEIHDLLDYTDLTENKIQRIINNISRINTEYADILQNVYNGNPENVQKFYDFLKNYVYLNGTYRSKCFILPEIMTYTLRNGDSVYNYEIDGKLKLEQFWKTFKKEDEAWANRSWVSSELDMTYINIYLNRIDDEEDGVTKYYACWLDDPNMYPLNQAVFENNKYEIRSNDNLLITNDIVEDASHELIKNKKINASDEYSETDMDLGRVWLSNTRAITGPNDKKGVYFVAETKNGHRLISEVYDLTTVYMNVYFCETDGTADEVAPGYNGYYLLFEIANKESLYYLNYFNYKIHVDFRDQETNDIRFKQPLYDKYNNYRELVTCDEKIEYNPFYLQFTGNFKSNIGGFWHRRTISEYETEIYGPNDLYIKTKLKLCAIDCLGLGHIAALNIMPYSTFEYVHSVFIVKYKGIDRVDVILNGRKIKNPPEGEWKIIGTSEMFDFDTQTITANLILEPYN